MKIITIALSFLALVLCITSCSRKASAPGAQYDPSWTSSGPKAQDISIGGIFIGMTEADLYSKKGSGTPQKNPVNGELTGLVSVGGLSVKFDDKKRVKCAMGGLDLDIAGKNYGPADLVNQKTMEGVLGKSKEVKRFNKTSVLAIYVINGVGVYINYNEANLQAGANVTLEDQGALSKI